MKPLWMSLTAFGPYSEEQVVDFRNYLADGLFLIHGKTGAGKSTILDALLYLLYGAKGGEKGLGILRSHYAMASMDTVVCLDFSLGQRYFRVRRTIKVHSRQNGNTELKESVFFGERQDKPNSTYMALESDSCYIALGNGNKSDATSLIQGLIGLDASQFQRVIILPQGKFRDLLVSSTAEKEAILASLFGTDRFDRLLEMAKNRLRTAETKHNALQAHRESILKSLSMPDTLALELECQTLAQNLVVLESQAKIKQEELDRAKLLLQASLILSDSWKRFNFVNSEIQNQESLRPQIELRKKSLAKNRALSNFKPLITAIKNNDSIIERLQKEIAECQISLPDLTQAADSAQKKYQNLVQANLITALERNSLRENLSTERSTSEQFHKYSQELAQKQAIEPEAQQELSKSQAEWQAIIDSEANFQRDTQRFNLGNRCVEILRNYYKDLERLLEKTKVLDALEQELVSESAGLQKTEQELSTCQHQVETCQAILHQTKLAQRSIAIATLAPELITGAPCPLCGSTDHASRVNLPAELEGMSDQEDRRKDLEIQLARQGTLQSNLNHSKSMLVKLQERIEDAKAAISQEGNTSSLEEFKSILSTSGIDTSAYHQVTSLDLPVNITSLKLAELLKLVSRFGTVFKDHIQSLSPKQIDPSQKSKIEQAREHHRTNLITIQTTIKDLSHRLHEMQMSNQSIRSLAILEIELQKIQTAENKDRQLLEAARNLELVSLQELDRKRNQLEHLSNQIQESLRQGQNFREDLNQAKKDLDIPLDDFFQNEIPSSQDLELEEKAIQIWGENLAALLAEQQRLQIQIRDYHDHDLKDLEDSVTELEVQYKNHDTQRLNMANRVSILASNLKILAEIDRESSSGQSYLSDLRRIVAVLSGNNDKGISLQRYALSVYLDEVLLEANHRLAKMTEGRYRLLRTEERGDARKGAGLDLAVSDEYTGADRPVQSLSGGESFMAALSLALGLSDVVQANSGGIRLDTLFIDEGFGSLDEESLQGAMSILEQLSALGRCLGIISHVKELQERIPRRLYINRGRRGSQIICS